MDNKINLLLTYVLIFFIILHIGHMSIIYFGEFAQEECADQMHIARTTVQRIYNDAGKKLA